MQRTVSDFFYSYQTDSNENYYKLLLKTHKDVCKMEIVEEQFDTIKSIALVFKYI